jgi:hypothetical protein
MEQAEQAREHALAQTERWRGLAEQANSDRDKALASVEGGEDIHPSDPRVMHIWRKASRIATTQGFCAEYDRIAEALGIPDIEIAYTGYISVSYSGTVSVPVSGTADRSDIANGNVDFDIDKDDILENLDSYSFSWEVEEVEIEAEEE